MFGGFNNAHEYCAARKTPRSRRWRLGTLCNTRGPFTFSHERFLILRGMTAVVLAQHGHCSLGLATKLIIIS